jgi:hypothetical protein
MSYHHSVDPRVITGLTYEQLGLRPKFLFWLTTKSWVTTRMPVKATWVSTRMAFVSCLIYARTCHAWNGYSTGHVDVSYTCYLMEAFMLQRDGLALGMCAQWGLFSNRRWQFFCCARHDGEHISDITCSSLRALTVFALFCRHDHANSSYQSINTYQVTEKGYDPSCGPAAGPL